ncbi:MAG: insulinase family protein [Candidatus Omnitrophica bacterium]|jgi:predicted Zn-dependent peptidase|nr:insulinase family protein [Candidatus Omnitrophota bacterium]
MYNIANINGATFIFSPFKNLETASLGVFIKIGSRFEAKKLRGISHFLEHMVFKGSKDYSYREIKREIEGRGGALNGFTSQETTAYYAHFLNKNLPVTLDILLDMVFCPRLNINDITKERNVILEEIKMYNDLPASRAASILDKLVWPDNSLGEEIIGDFSTVSRIKRADLSNFRDIYYKPSNLVISCSGDYNREKVLNLLKEKIKKIPQSINLKYTAPRPLYGMHVEIENKKIEQTHLCIGFRSVSYLSQQKFVAELINVILGANMSSRLFEEIREKKALCYEISTDVRKYRDSGVFVVHAGLNKDKIKIAIASIFKELEKIKEIKVSDCELIRAKDYILGQIIMGLERPQGRMFYLAENYLSLGKIYSLEEIKEEIKKVTAEEIRKLSREIFKFNNLCVSCVGDVDGKTEKLIRKILSSFK